MRILSRLLSVVALASVGGLIGAAQLEPTGSIQAAPAFTAQQQLAPPTHGWITNAGTLYVINGANDVFAMDVESGEQLRQVQAERWEEGFAITAAPLYFDGKVIMGFNGGELEPPSFVPDTEHPSEAYAIGTADESPGGAILQFIKAPPR